MKHGSSPCTEFTIPEHRRQAHRCAFRLTGHALASYRSTFRLTGHALASYRSVCATSCQPNSTACLPVSPSPPPPPATPCFHPSLLPGNRDGSMRRAGSPGAAHAHSAGEKAGPIGEELDLLKVTLRANVRKLPSPRVHLSGFDAPCAALSYRLLRLRPEKRPHRKCTRNARNK